MNASGNNQNSQVNVAPSIAELKSRGIYASVMHFRLVKQKYILPRLKLEVDIPVEMPIFEVRRKGLISNLIAKGGYTTVKLFDGKNTIIGTSSCHPNDHYDNKLGARFALEDAWKQYLEMGYNR